MPTTLSDGADDDVVELAAAPIDESAAVSRRGTVGQRDLCTLAGFLLLFHVVFAALQAGHHPSAADIPSSSLLVRAAAAALVWVVLRWWRDVDPRVLAGAEILLLGVEVCLLLAAQYHTAIALIDHRDLVDAVAVQKNGVLRALVLMVAGAALVPHAPAVTARIAATIAAALILCHAMVLHHADTSGIAGDDVANHHIVMANALFLVMGVVLATIIAHRLRGAGTPVERSGAARDPET